MGAGDEQNIEIMSTSFFTAICMKYQFLHHFLPFPNWGGGASSP